MDPFPQGHHRRRCTTGQLRPEVVEKDLEVQRKEIRLKMCH